MSRSGTFIAVTVVALAGTACTSTWRYVGGAHYSQPTGVGATAGAVGGIGTTIADHTALLATAGADIGVGRQDGDTALIWSTQLGIDLVRQLHGRSMAVSGGVHAVFLSGPGDRDYLGPGLRAAVFPRARRSEQDQHATHPFFADYWRFENVGIQLDVEYVNERARDPGQLEGEREAGWVISVSAVYERNNIHR